MRIRPLISVATLLCFACPVATVHAQSAVAASPRTVQAERLREGDSLTIDGHVDEPAWRRAMPAANFLQLEPDNGSPATERTDVRVLYDRQNLYLGVWCFDSEPNRVLGNQMQRDRAFEADDRFMWILDTFLDGRTGYYFEINPSGAMGDGLVTPATGGRIVAEVNRSWDGIWMARVGRTPEGWVAEIQIPFRTVNFDPNVKMWGINFQRTVRRKNEESLWTGYALNQGLTRVNSAGHLVGLTNVSQGLGLDIKPYLVGHLSAAPGRGRAASLGDADAGLDVFYNLTPSLRANFTVNTDFAETEVDQRRVNLTRFPLFFEEKRDFFLEGSSLFTFSSEPGNSIVPFFSRRIGLDSDGNPQRILYGAKLTGQAGRYDVGVLHVRTGDEKDRGLSGEDFTVMRSRRRFLARSYVGAVYTRRGGGDVEPTRHTAGVDFELATATFRGSQNLEFSGFYLHTSNPDGTGGSDGYALRLNFPNDPWSLRVSTRALQEQYNPAVGFVERNNYRRYNPAFIYSPRPRAHPYIRRLVFAVNADFIVDLKNSLATRTFSITALQADFHSGDSITFSVTPNYERLQEDFTIAPGITLATGETYDFTRYGIETSTASQRPLAVTARAELGRFYSGRRREYAAGFTLRPRPGWLVTLEGEHNAVDLAEGTFDADVVRAVINKQFNPWISLANNLQYDSVSRVLGWQFRFRWITRPGNDIYIVYTHNWRDDGGLGTLDRRGAAKIIRTYRF